MIEGKEPDYFSIAKGVVRDQMRMHQALHGALSDAEKIAYEGKIQRYLDIIAAQDKLIKEYQELIELLRKASA